jgi:hypothetical protein
MPWKYEWFDAPKNPDLPVQKQLPPGARQWHFLYEFQAIDPAGEVHHWTLCKHCEGWIPAKVNEYPVNTLDDNRKTGRKGTEYYCPRCGKEIHFSGTVG